MGRTPVEHIAQMLLLARPGGEGGAPPPRPWFLPALLVASAYSLCSKSSLEENRRVLWDKVGHLGGGLGAAAECALLCSHPQACPPMQWLLSSSCASMHCPLLKCSLLPTGCPTCYPQVLSHDAVARLLLVVHQQLERARHPRHQAQALTPLQVHLGGVLWAEWKLQLVIA